MAVNTQKQPKVLPGWEVDYQKPTWTLATSAITTTCFLYYIRINLVLAATPLGQPLLFKATNLSLTTHNIFQLPQVK